MVEYIKNKKIIILFLITIFFGIKTNFLKNTSELVQYNYNERLINNYGYCSNESIGYLKYLKKKYDITDNPKIINYAQAPNVTWSIINTQNINNNSNKMILLNYPGKKFKSYLTKVNESLFEFSDHYFLSNKFKKINYIEISNSNINKINIKMDIYTVTNKNKKIIKSLIIKNLKTSLNLSADEINEESKIFFEIKNLNKIKVKDLNFSLNLQNKYNLEDYQIIEKEKNCYYIK